MFFDFLILIGQLMVVMFLLYSGYGVMESYKRKGNNYISGFFSKRVLKTLLHFDLAVVLFIVLALILGHEFSTKQYILSLIGWESVGNSNWFVFDIIALYIIAYIGLLIVRKYKLNVKHYIAAVYLITFLLAIVLYKIKPIYWCDTILAFPTGMLWSVYRDKIETKLKSQVAYTITLLISIVSFAILTYLGNIKAEVFWMFATAVFGIIVVLITMRLHIGNKALHWLGVNAFSIYILQRIPMIIATEYELHLTPMLFMAVVLPIVLIMGDIFTRFTNKIDSRIFK